MRKIAFSVFALLLIGISLKGQILSQFTFEDPGNNERIAAIGPNATSSGTNAFCQLSGTSGKGCNAGESCTLCNSFCYSNINLIVPNLGSIFDVPEIDVSIDYRHFPNTCSGGQTEVDAWFFQRGNFAFGLQGGRLAFSYTVDQAGLPFHVRNGNSPCNLPNGTLTVQQCFGCDSTQFSPVRRIIQDGIILDNQWHNYRFTYTQSDGLARIYIDGENIYTQTTACYITPGDPLRWVGAPAAIAIGPNMDGMGNNVPIIDNPTIGTPVPLPIKLSRFEGKIVGVKSHLVWETQTETNNDFFTVQRSTDGEHFAEIGKVKGSGNSSTPIEYSFVDDNPQKGSNFYRLKNTDLDGKYEIYQTIELYYDSKASGLISLYPNPVNGAELHIQFEAGTDMASGVQIFDLSGREVLFQKSYLSKGIHNLILEVGQLPEGMYIVKMVAGGKVYTDKFLKTSQE
ncbi:MAG: T9SS type A sorting domain-containing protein [Bacteroidia bacterium]|nr:T9SS type A sorting domain-containing protein [Bacteroidia bacterium]